MESEVTSDSTNYQNHPKYMKSLLGKTVELTTTNGKTQQGVVHVIDPVTDSVVLITGEEKYDSYIFMGHAVQSLHVIHPNECMTTYTTNNDVDKWEVHQIVKDKKADLLYWLKKNLLVVEEDGEDLKIGSDVVIVPPYNMDSCFSSNTIILQRIRDIIRMADADADADTM